MRICLLVSALIVVPHLFANDNDVSDFSWSKVTWLHQNVGSWRETSRISSVSVKTSGEVCVKHSKSGVWRDGGKGVAGNPWIIVKLNGKYYAGTWEWLRPGQTCKLGQYRYGLRGLYSSKDSLPRHIKVEPLNSWVPQGGETVGFMMSTLARSGMYGSNGQERSNVHWYRLPRPDGSGGGAVSSGGGDSSSGDGVAHQIEGVSNAKGVVEGLARQYADALRVSYNAYPSGGPTDTKKAEFWDRAIQKLRSMNEGFGYVLASDGKYMTDLLCHVPAAYRSSQGNPTGSRVEFTSVDFISGGNPSRIWWSVWPPEKVRQKYPGGHGAHKGRCVFPRPGAPDYGYGSGGGTVSGSGGNTAVSPQTTGSCRPDQRIPNWKDVGGKCLPSCGHAKNLYCKSNDCSGLSISRRCTDADMVGFYKAADLETYQSPPPCCMVGRGEPPSGSVSAGAPPTAQTNCETLGTQISELQNQLDEQIKAYEGRRQKKWLGLRRDSCRNVQLCESLANNIHLARENPSMAPRLDHYKREFRRNCKNFERCQSIASSIESIRRSLDEAIRVYNSRCRR